ncbi:IclR family transcriptional regulator [Nocardioides korecus]
MQSVDRAVHLLRAVAGARGGAGSGTVALGDACGLNRATAWRLLSTLESHGLVTCDRVANQWTIGAGLVDIVRVSGLDAVLRDAHATLEQLAASTGETASLAVLRQGALVYADEVVPASPVAANWSGREVSLHATSTGKVLLAWSSAAQRAELLARRREVFTATTVTDLAALRRELDQARERGWAACRGEFDEQAWGVAAPVLDHAGRLLAVLSIWGPRDRIPEERLPELGEVVRTAAAELSGDRATTPPV